MTAEDRDKWERRYRDGAYVGREHPSALLVEWLGHTNEGPVLDVACGIGRNALYLGSHGRQVDAIDIAPTALERGRRAAAERGLPVRWIEADLEPDPDSALPCGPYALIVLVRFVHRGILPALLQRLAAGGTLIVEEHLDTDAEVVGPSNPAFRMRPNELLHSTLAAPHGPGLEVRYYREGLVTDPDGRRAALAQLVARIASR